MPNKTKVLIVDDSASMRMLIRSILTEDHEFEVVGIASDGLEAVEKAQAIRPDLITMDVEMPRMDGIAAVRQIMAKCPTRIIMLSSITKEGVKTTFEALDSGALDYVTKTSSGAFAEELKAKARDAAKTRFASSQSAQQSRQAAASAGLATLVKSRKTGILAIGASTGGPVAITELLSAIPAGFPYPVCLAVHMPKAFTQPFAERLNSKCTLNVKEAADGDIIKPGNVYVAPGGVHMTLVRNSSAISVKLAPITDFPKHVYVPSVDLMISSLVEASNAPVLGVILTGMGNDGFKGMMALKQKGGIVVAQDEATSTVFGMPKACIAGGLADLVLPLEEIGPEIGRIV